MTTGKFIRIALVGLPAGIALLASVAVLVTHLSPDWLYKSSDEHAKERMEVAHMNQKNVNEADLRNYVKILSETIGERHLGKYDSLKKAAIWIESTLGQSNAGYLIQRQSYDVGQNKVWNVIAELPGTSRRNEMIVIGARYDSALGSPGANANATGTAAMVALARAFAGSPQERTIQFVGFTGGDPTGSFFFVNDAKVNRKKIVAAINLESLGFFSPETDSQKTPAGWGEEFRAAGDFVAFISDPASKELAGLAQNTFFRGSEIPVVVSEYPPNAERIGKFDQTAFWEKGFPALMLTDTAEYRNSHFNSPTDTMDQVDFEKLTSVVMGMKFVIEVLANP